MWDDLRAEAHYIAPGVEDTDRVKRGEEALIRIEEVFDGLLERYEARKARKTR
jgi:hypothetical protein